MIIYLEFKKLILVTLKQHSIKTIYIDATNADFIYNESHLKVITDALDKDLEQGQHYFSLP